MTHACVQNKALQKNLLLPDLLVLAQGSDALGAHVFTHQATILHDFYTLNIRPELPFGFLI
jgi:hypothetical protein